MESRLEGGSADSMLSQLIFEAFRQLAYYYNFNIACLRPLTGPSLKAMTCFLLLGL